MTKHCAYCLAPHSERGRCCCPEHAAKLNRQLSAEASGRARAVDRQLAIVHKRAKVKVRWREIAMGRNVTEHLRAAFPKLKGEVPKL